jgi:hypothetical protein
VATELIEHVAQEWQRGRNVVHAATVQIDFDPDTCFARVALDGRFS